MIPVMKPTLPSFRELRPLLKQLDRSHIYSNYGPISWNLRLAYSRYLGVSPERIIPLANATLALQGCLEISEQHDWIIPDYTFAATGHAAVSAGKKIHIADVKKDNFHLQIPDDLDRKLFGAVPVMPFGAPIVFEDWLGFIAVVIDAAASLGSPPPNFDLMPENSMVVYSLHATKVLGAGEGALVVCSSDELAQNLRSWSNFGFDGSRQAVIRGTNAKLSETSCAFALASISKVKSESKEWIRALTLISSLDIPEIIRTKVDSYPGFRPYWIIQADSYQEKTMLTEHLRSNGIESRSWWPAPLSQMPAFSDLSKLGSGDNSRYFSDTHLGLPIWRKIPTKDIFFIASQVNHFYNSNPNPIESLV